MNKVLRFFYILALFGFLASCGEDPNIGEEILDDELRANIEKASPTGRIDFFKLPESDDFVNIPQDPNNPLTSEKVELGRLLFHETGLATEAKLENGMYTYSCASCHHVNAGFQAGLRQGIGEGGIGFGIRGEGRFMSSDYAEEDLDVQPMRSPSALNVAYQKVMLWSGKFGAKGVNQGTEAFWVPGTPVENNNLNFEGVETQALAGLTVHRLKLDIEEIAVQSTYKESFDQAFPYLDENQRYNNQNTALAIAAYERTLLANQAPFQKWLSGNLDAMNEAEKRGANLFFGKANCVSCHTGPALSTVGTVKFYALGMNDLIGSDVIQSNPAAADHLGRGGFTQVPEDMYKFKVPQLYNMKDSPFYGHGGSFTSIEEVVRYKNHAIAENPDVSEALLAQEFIPLDLTNEEIADLTSFLEEALYDSDLTRYVPSNLPSALCFPNNDPDSQQELGCQ
ncbi:MAG: cytochrome c peroxidase [Bacteroidota bacterium]